MRPSRLPRRDIGEAGDGVFRGLRAAMPSAGAFSPDADSAGRRALANAALAYLSAAKNDPALAEGAVCARRPT